MIKLGTSIINRYGEPLRLCTHNCAEPHFENCRTCFGFGLKVGKTMPLALVNADTAFSNVPIDPRPCPECGTVITLEATHEADPV